MFEWLAAQEALDLVDHRHALARLGVDRVPGLVGRDEHVR
jgi:hypothetical protein